ncbi:MAG: CDP-archaeol synthase [Kordiimonadaceae bacterium]|nr:CDP-archaeol synthase [Kordiimonadaceae bacterium]
MLGAVYFGGWYFVAFLTLGGVLMATEWVSLTITKNGLFFLATISTLVAIEAIVFWQATVNFVPALSFLAVSTLVGAIIVKSPISSQVGWFIAGIGYVGMPILSLTWLRGVDHWPLVTWVLFVVFATDVGGYVFGKNIGGPKLAPRLSPKKTWSGLLGGMLLSAIIGYLFHITLDVMASATTIILVSALLAVWAQIGDLVESGIKRHFDVKDSGALIPGHGGLLDRVDGLVFVAPAVVLLFLWQTSWFIVVPS